MRWGNPADGMSSAKVGHIFTFVLRTIWILAVDQQRLERFLVDV